MEDYRRYREEAVKAYQEQKSVRLGLRGGGTARHPARSALYREIADIVTCLPAVDTDELESNVDDWEEETIEFFISEEVIPFGDL